MLQKQFWQLPQTDLEKREYILLPLFLLCASWIADVMAGALVAILGLGNVDKRPGSLMVQCRGLHQP